MHEFTARYAHQIQGVLSGFDRLVFRGSLCKIAYPFGMQGYLWAKQVPMTRFGAHVNDSVARGVSLIFPKASKPGRPAH